MLLSLRDITGYRMMARDGEIGKVTDFLFDQRDWSIRYIVDKTSALFGKQVLIDVSAIKKISWSDQVLELSIDKKQVRESPDIDFKSILKKENEQKLIDHFQGTVNWTSIDKQGTLPLTRGLSLDIYGDKSNSDYARLIVQDTEFDPEGLQSSSMAVNFKISTNNGHLGHAEDFIIDDSNWMIRFMVIDTRGGQNKKKILLRPESIDWISWRKKHVSVNMDKEKIQGCPNFEVSFPLSQEYADLLYNQFECSNFWA